MDPGPTSHSIHVGAHGQIMQYGCDEAAGQCPDPAENGVAIRIVRRRAGLWLAGVSLVALAATGIPKADAQAVQIVNKGADGESSTITFGFRNTATAGENAAGVTYQLLSPISGTSGTAVDIGSIGGRGGAGDFSPLAVNEPGANGGSAGNVIVTLSRDVSGGSNQTVATALVSAYSIGGAGGTGWYQNSADRGFGSGGTAGSVTLYVDNSVNEGVAASGNGMSAVSAISAGGGAGARTSVTGSYGGTGQGRQTVEVGANGGTVTVESWQFGRISTSGDNAPAVYAASLGGAGGRADANTATYYGSNGGAGGLVNFYNGGTIATLGAASSGVILQSVGGAGGKGAGGAWTAAAGGAAGGNGGTIKGSSTGSITTAGDYSLGFVAQSIGGSGGQGKNATFGSGGDGGAAGYGGAVTLDNQGKITTAGAGATAIIAQSIGGADALSAFWSTNPSVSGGGGSGGGGGILPWSSGGAGGPGGGGGMVTLTQRGTITTAGDSAYGALLQSIGGGGGTGGTGYSVNAFLSVALGGAGGSGGDGAAVVYNGTAGSIETSGSKATGVLAQSIGGGGGAGGAASSKAIGFGVSASSAIGGQGGGGGNGGAVTITNGGSIRTWGANAQAINAASIGGGGGNGGNANAFSVALPIVTPSGQSLPSVAISSAVGGIGGDGGSGGSVVASNSNFAVMTYGIGSTAVELQSIGGGGGVAGDAVAYALAISTPQSSSVSVSAAIGGSGGGGGNGGKVEFRNSGQIETYNEAATGILAQSIGGGGGNGGTTNAAANAVSLRNSFMYTLSVGGSGGRGGNGGDVSVDHSGSYGLVRTFGDNAVAIFGQSIGGGGGNGGDVISVAATDLGLGKGLGGLADKFILGKSFTGTTTLGGSGGDGGSGGRVQITTGRSASLVTFGSQSSAIFAQSIGGGGGTGGGGTERATGTFALKLSIGGAGGRGGTGGDVNVAQQGTITTFGDASHGIFAQSVGGGGGDGGNLTAMASATPDTISQLTKTIEKALGKKKYADWVLKNGAPDTKAKLDKLIADLKGSELSQAVQNSELFKQLSSLNNFIKQQNAAGIQFPSVSLTMSMGGTGGSGDTGGLVDISNQGSIKTGGNVAHGVLAQSIGGGGGNGGTAYGSGASKLNLIASLGGSGSSGGSGGSVVVGNSGVIQTGGDAAYGLFAQSVGGGGGTGVGGLSSQNKDITINAIVGGKGGSGNVGGAVSVTNSNSISTKGAESHGVLAQSVGGGGGTFTMNLETKDANERYDPMGTVPPDTLAAFLKAFGLEQVPSAAPVDPNAAKAGIKSAAVTLGGSGGTGGNGGAVSVAHSGAITTTGEGAFAILAQSVGGGGGLSNAAGSPGGVKWSASLGGSGGVAGNGGSVSVNLTGNSGPSKIATSGNAATGVFAQSVGGGGGYGGASVLLGWSLPGIGGAGGSSGDGGAISVTAAGSGTDIKTTGTFAHGIWAQSLGGGGGAVRNVLNLAAPGPTTTIDRSTAKGRGGAITINIAKGNISATGTDSFGILAQSGFQKADGSLSWDPLYGSQRGNNININYTGTIVGGSGGGAAIGIDGGGAYDSASRTAYKNTIVIGAGSTISALSGKAILASSGDDNVVNHGTIIGDIDLSVGDARTVDSFLNDVDGTYRSAGAGTIKLGGEGVGYASPFTNRGTFDIGGVGKIATATLTNGTMELGGSLLVDVTSVAGANAPTSDRLQAARLKLDGVAIMPYAVGGLLPGSFTVATATEWLQGGTPATAGGSEWSPISWTVSQGANSLSISPTASFVAAAESLPSAKLTTTERSMLESAQVAWNSSNTAAAGLFAQAANVTTPEQFANLINSASASESNNLPTIGQTLDALQSLNAAMSCPAFEGDSINIHEGQCVWARGIGSRLSRTASGRGEGFEQDSMDYRIGAQWEIAPDWYLGATAGYNNSWLTTSDGLSTTTGTGGDVSVALKHQMGPLLLAASVYGGYGTFDTDNDLVIGALEGNASNDTEVWTAGLKMRAAYEFAFEHWYLRPYVDVNALHSYMPAYTFTANGMTIQSDSIDHWSGELETVLEAGSRFDLGDHGWIRPYVGIGGTFVANNRIVASSSFSDGALKGIAFETTEELPSALLDLGAGVQFMSRDNYEIRGQYKAQIAEDFLNQEISLRLSLKF